MQLYREYRDIVGQFSYVVETERRFYLCNAVDLQVRNPDGDMYFEVRMSDAWVWDMYRPARFVKNVRVVTFKDVNVEELDKPELRLPDGRTSADGAGSSPGVRFAEPMGQAGSPVLPFGGGRPASAGHLHQLSEGPASERGPSAFSGFSPPVASQSDHRCPGAPHLRRRCVVHRTATGAGRGVHLRKLCTSRIGRRDERPATGHRCCHGSQGRAGSAR